MTNREYLNTLSTEEFANSIVNKVSFIVNGWLCFEPWARIAFSRWLEENHEEENK